MCAVRVSGRVSVGYIVSGGVEGFVHRLSKEARRELVELVVEAVGSIKEAAERIGVSRQAVHAFLAGTTHPRDEVVVRILRVLSLSAPYWRRRALEILRREMEAVVAGFSAVMELLGPAEGGGLDDYL